MPVKTLKQYLNWKPVPHSVLKDKKLRKSIHEQGFHKMNLLDSKALSLLKEIYRSEHQFEVKEGGMFYSLYSRDKAYRMRVHTAISEVLEPVLNEHFSAYKNVVNFFITKLPGASSEFYVHQDATGLDEFNFSPLTLWVPLDDITPQNGALTLIEKTHWFFSPFRGVSIPFPFKNINETIKRYLNPVYLKAGEALLFDNRLVHSSMENSSKKERVAIVCGIFPKEATFRSCYHNGEIDSPIEIFEHGENYLLNYDHFFYNCTDRPTSGKVVEKINELFSEMSSDEFEELCELNNIPERNLIEKADPTTINCQMIAEPDGINRFSKDKKASAGWLGWIKSKMA